MAWWPCKRNLRASLSCSMTIPSSSKKYMKTLSLLMWSWFLPILRTSKHPQAPIQFAWKWTWQTHSKWTHFFRQNLAFRILSIACIALCLVVLKTISISALKYVLALSRFFFWISPIPDQCRLRALPYRINTAVWDGAEPYQIHFHVLVSRVWRTPRKCSTFENSGMTSSYYIARYH